MNEVIKNQEVYQENSFRPQQGLPIMNMKTKVDTNRIAKIEFPSPTGVTYYE